MKYSKDMDYYLDKACTIIVRDINWHYKVEAMMDYFVGIVHCIDDKHIWMKHSQTKCLNCIAMEYVVNICEEQLLFENNPEHKKIIEEYRNEKPEIANKTVVTEQKETKPKFIDVKNLASLVKSQGS